MFIFILAAVALADYVIIFCCIVNMVSKSNVSADETPEYVFKEEEGQTMNNADIGFVCEEKDFDSYFKDFNSYDKDINSYIEDQNSRIALLSCNVDKILSNIDAIIERNEANRSLKINPSSTSTFPR